MSDDITRAEFDRVLDRVVPRKELFEPSPANDAVIYAGDSFHVLTHKQDFIPNGSVDLIYIDPPWNTSDTYVSIWGEKGDAKVMSFSDDFSTIGDYIAYMNRRVKPLAAKLKPTGTFFYHCDWHSSHYVKAMLDGIFGYQNFLSEIIWKRTSARSDSHRVNHIHDTIFAYSWSKHFTFNSLYKPYDKAYLDKFYRHVDESTGRKYRVSDLMASGTRKGSSGQPWRGVDPAERGNHWKYTIEKLEELDKAGRIHWPKTGSVPAYKRYLDEMPGVPLQSIWDDIPPIQAQSPERHGYPTQKPLALLKRIVEMSSNKGDLVLDAFCGGGTTIVAAQQLGRRWIGIDISHQACRTVAERLEKTCGLVEGLDFHVWGMDINYMTLPALERMSPDEFESWAIDQLQWHNPIEVKPGQVTGRYYPVDKIRYEELRKRIMARTAQLDIFDQLYKPVRVLKSDVPVGPEVVEEYQQALTEDHRQTGFLISLKGFEKRAIQRIVSIFKGKGVKIVPASGYQIVRGKATAINQIQAAPESFEKYIRDFELLLAA